MSEKTDTKTAETPAAPVTDAPAATGMQTQGTQAIAATNRPAFMQTGDSTGIEGFGPDDIKLPRLAIAQAMSPQLADPAQAIDGLKLGMFFNDLSGEVYGPGPLHIVVVRRDVRRIQFKPRAEGGGVLDLNVPANDPRNDWNTDDKGGRIPPLATLFNEYVVFVMRDGFEPEPIVLSIKDTNKFNRKTSERLTGFIKFHPGPVFSAVYSVRTVNEKNDEGTFGVFVIDKMVTKENPKGYVEDENLYRMAERFEASLRGKTISVNREPGSDDGDTDFPTDDGPKM